MKKNVRRIVIIGGGFGGITAAKRLIARTEGRAIEILLINRYNYILYTPMLHEVATGGLNRHSIVEPLRRVLRGSNFRFWQCQAIGIDFRKRQIKTISGVLPYDTVLLATGSQPNFLGIPGAAQHALPLKSIEDANRIRDRIITCLERAAKKPGEQAALLTFVVVGGGPTGVEVMGEMVEFVKQMLSSDYHEIDRRKVRFILIQRGMELVPQAHAANRRKIAKKLERMGVEVHYSSASKVTAEGVELNGKRFLRAGMVIWTAGVKPQTIPTNPPIVDARGKYPTDQFLQIKGVQHAYAIGDCAAMYNPGGQLVPDLAQSAIVEGKAVADNILAVLDGRAQQPFVFKQKGFLVSVGRYYGVAEIGPIRFSGFFAWWLMRTIYLFKMIGRAQKFKVAFDWTVQLFSKRDTTQI